jgi:hypothetical protein
VLGRAAKPPAPTPTSRPPYAQEKAEAVAIFDFLERHWLQLVNGIESQIIPKTNNAVELVTRSGSL